MKLQPSRSENHEQTQINRRNRIGRAPKIPIYSEDSCFHFRNAALLGRRCTLKDNTELKFIMKIRGFTTKPIIELIFKL